MMDDNRTGSRSIRFIYRMGDTRMNVASANECEYVIAFADRATVTVRYVVSYYVKHMLSNTKVFDFMFVEIHWEASYASFLANLCLAER